MKLLKMYERYARMYEFNGKRNNGTDTESDSGARVVE